MQIHVFGLEEPESRGLYDGLFENCPSAFLQQSTLWAEVISPLGPDTPIFILALRNGEPIAGLPLYLFRHRLGNVLTSVPQAGPQGGVFHLSNLTPEERAECYAGLLAEALSQAILYQCISLSVITNPFGDDLALYQQYLAPDYILENFTQSNDMRKFIGPSGDILLRDYNRRSNLSRNINNGRRAGLTSRVGLRDGDLSILYNLHCKRHAEIGASVLDQRLLENIATILVPKQKATFLMVEAAETIVSWGIYLYHREVMDVLRLNMDSSAADLSPNFFNTEVSFRLARSLNVATYNWQSSPLRNDGVYRYKQQWGATESAYYYVTRLLCSVDYLREMGLDTIRIEYPMHFTIPYLSASKDFTPGFYRKGERI